MTHGHTRGKKKPIDAQYYWIRFNIYILITLKKFHQSLSLKTIVRYLPYICNQEHRHKASDETHSRKTYVEDWGNFHRSCRMEKQTYL